MASGSRKMLDSLRTELVKAVSTHTTQKVKVSDEDYSRIFTNFFNGYGEYSHIHARLLQAIQSSFESSVPLNILDIGCGFQPIACSLPKHICSRVKQFCVYEPNTIFDRGLNDLISTSFPQLFAAPEINVQPFSDKTELKQMWDIMIFSHSLYGMIPKKSHLQAAINGLKPSGIIFIVHQSQSASGILKILKELLCCVNSYSLEAAVVIKDQIEHLDDLISFLLGYGLSTVPLELRDMLINYGTRRAEGIVEFLVSNTIFVVSVCR